jgi:hypothetical protein
VHLSNATTVAVTRRARMPGRKGGSWCKSSAVPQL